MARPPLLKGGDFGLLKPTSSPAEVQPLMNFIGTAKPLSQQGLDSSTQLLGTGAEEIWTFLSVETKGCGYQPDRRPVILFERHIFHRQTAGVYDASNPSISSPIPGGYLGGALEYGRLQQAINLNANAALNSTSWGIGQVMGFNSAIAGFSSVESMVEAMVEGEDAQLAAAVHCLIANKLNGALASHRWEAFALGYNGPNYRENHYDVRLAAAYASFSSGALPQLAVRQTQMLLTFLGIYSGQIDGIPGKLTNSAIAQFRQQQGLGMSSMVDLPLITAIQLKI
jgi:hypothetical protein